MPTPKRGRLPSVRRFLRHRRDRSFLTISFVRNEVAGEDLEYVLAGTNNRSHIQSNVDRTGYQALPPDLVTGQSESKNGPDNGNGFNQALRDAPPACSDNSSFHCTHRPNPCTPRFNVSIARCDYGQL